MADTIYTIDVIERVRIVEIIASRPIDSNDTTFWATYYPYGVDSRDPDAKEEVMLGANMGQVVDETDFPDLPQEVKDAWAVINVYFTELAIEQLRQLPEEPPEEVPLPPPNPDMPI